ncbi:DUF1707 domain-containing protein [Saxibacter everestensis]|uniref:DUF1707 domain-containing protein n=1 Tax=Saxibacter everestensis TaxID=2909229 RepID=A0ABY8QU97_9MICO|nr:DUF1707 domain-containing protein [Brevibacteriaceae bacterium ZFBP1038]
MTSSDDAVPVWEQLSKDPRDPQYAQLRASDQDRAIVSQVVADAYADGRLDREEYDERAESVLSARMLGEFPPLLEDLLPVTGIAEASGKDFPAQAERSYRRGLRARFTGFASTSAITGAIWIATSFMNGDPYFFWPIFPIVGTGIGVVTQLINKRDVIEDEVRHLERREQKRRQAIESEPGALPARPIVAPTQQHLARHPHSRDQRRQDLREWRAQRRDDRRRN